MSGQRGLRARIAQLIRTTDQHDADELRADTTRLGARCIADLELREIATVSGVLRSTTLAPLGHTPSLTAEMYDGTQKLHLVWLGRRTIRGVRPGTYVRATGRVCDRAGVRTIYNPSYEILLNRGQ